MNLAMSLCCGAHKYLGDRLHSTVACAEHRVSAWELCQSHEVGIFIFFLSFFQNWQSHEVGIFISFLFSKRVEQQTNRAGFTVDWWVELCGGCLTGDCVSLARFQQRPNN